jgi:DNA anti-recombination protein RmuC
MEAMAKNWTDERLEERFDRIDLRFDEVDRRFEQVDRRFEQLDRRFEEVNAEFRELRGEMNGRFDALQRLIIQMLATLIVGFVGVIATLATQL